MRILSAALALSLSAAAAEARPIAFADQAPPAGVLILPLAIPVMIFGVGMADPLAGGGATLFLIALSLVVTAFSPFAAALALRAAGE